MTQAMTQSSISDDLQVALAVARQWNANPHRASTSRSAAVTMMAFTTQAEKPLKSSEFGFPITPESVLSTPNSDSPDNSSSPNRFPQSLKESTSNNPPPFLKPRSNMPRCKLPDSKMLETLSIGSIWPALQGKRPRGLTDISISEADARSVPPPGPELLEKADIAKRNGEVPMIYNLSVIRLVNGKWMVPQKCNSCQGISTTSKQRNRQQNCDRKHPCSVCIANGSVCEQGNLMTVVVSSKRLAQLSNILCPNSGAEAVFGFTIASHIGQNQDGTWSSIEQTQLYAQQPDKRKAEELHSPWTRSQGSPRPAAAQIDGRISTPLEAVSDSVTQKNDRILNFDVRTLPQPKGKKRKADEDLDITLPSTNSSLEIQGEDVLSVERTRTSKRNATASRGSGHVKYYQSMQGNKPAPYGKPPVWADKRQSLCQTLPYYKAYMSGAYMQCGLVRAFMVDKEVGPRDKFEEEIVISRAGGGRKLDEQSGQMIQQTDQETSSFALGFRRAMERKSPVAIIAGQGNKISPSKLPHYYNVLDWFHVTDVWCEKSGGFKCWMVRLEKVRLDTKSWWAPNESQPPNPNRDIDTVKTDTTYCESCKATSKEIYNAGWACLNTSCRDYFNFKKEVNDMTLDYNEKFMNERTRFTGGLLDPLVPPLMTDATLEENDIFGVEMSYKDGIVCPLCRGCSRRIEWHQWTCETPGCRFTYSVQQRIMKVHDAISQSFNLEVNSYGKDSGIRFSQRIMGMYDVSEYIIPGEGVNEDAGVVTHFKANGIINGQLDGPNDLFRFMQEGDFGLKRYPARQPGSPGEVLTSHWVANWGAPYKYSVSVLSKGFDEAPRTIIKALKRLTWAGEQSVAESLEPFYPFNELLSIGYFEATSIGYHDDGEKELGPTVASLSLGCQALMTLRPKAKCSLGGHPKNAKGTKPDVLKMVLRHGDLVVMHGNGIQKLYEHAVTPQGKLRFALTSRYIRPELMANDEERRQAEIKGRLPDWHKQYTYDGDIGKQLVELDECSQKLTEAQTSMNDFTARVIAGELDSATLQQCHGLLSQLVERMAVRET